MLVRIWGSFLLILQLCEQNGAGAHGRGWSLCLPRNTSLTRLTYEMQYDWLYLDVMFPHAHDHRVGGVFGIRVNDDGACALACGLASNTALRSLRYALAPSRTHSEYQFL